MSEFTNHIDKIFAPGGLLSHVLPGHETRPGQREMAVAVARTLAAGLDSAPGPSGPATAHMLAVEAETGIGKTLAYLVPAALCGGRVVVSTGTLNLQEQILDREIPLITRHFSPALTAVCVKGRLNYACLFRARQFLSSPQTRLFSRGGDLGKLHDWLESTTTGDRAELPWLPDGSELWERMSATSVQCAGSKCPDYSECFITRLRQRAAAANIIIVNHHLFFADLAIRRHGYGEVLPRYQAVVFDEAHHIENIATRYFGDRFSQRQAGELSRDIAALAAAAADPARLDGLVQTAQGLQARAAILASLFPAERGRFPLPAFIEDCPDWCKERDALARTLQALDTQLAPHAAGDERWEAVRRRAHEMHTAFVNITMEMNSSHVYWYERRDKSVSLSASPIEVAPPLRDYLYGSAGAIVFTSATLTTGGSFSYLFKRLGLDDGVDTLCLPSPFDYAGRTRLFVPPDDFPPPNARGYEQAMARLTHELIEASRGRALLLFTSVAAMNRTHGHLAKKTGYPLLRQGDAPKSVLLDAFRRDEHSVLLAVASFWEGVNVPGRSLSCVIIDKLPFEVPTDPVIMARMRHIEEEGGKPFLDFQVPRAVLALRQGVGRLMRAATDRGLLAIMDIRLLRKGYGKVFMRSLPRSPLIRGLDEVQSFFTETPDEC